MKQVKWALAVLMVITLVFVTACSSNNGTDSSTSTPTNNSTAPTTTPGNTDAPDAPTAPAEPIDPIGKYETPVKMTMAVQRTAQEFVSGETDEDNRWIKEYLNALNIDVDVAWAMPGGEYFERLGVTVATGDLPDVMAVDKVTLVQLVESDMIQDLTEVYEQYASPLLKSIIDLDGGGYAWKQASFDGRLMAAPERSANLAGKMIHIRKDWLDNLGLKPPTSIDELLEISRAFTYDDPDKNGQNDTLGLATAKDIVSWNLDLSAFINGYGGYPKIWLKDDAGKLVYGSIQPEVRAGLLKLQELYKDGQIDREFAVKDMNAVNADITAGKFGLAFGGLSTPISPFQNVKKLEDKLDVISVPLVSITGQPAKPEGSVTVNTFYVVRKGYEHPEALIKLQNLFVDIWYGEQAERYEEMITGVIDEKTHNYFQYAPIKATNQGKNAFIHNRIVDALDDKLPVSDLNTEEKNYYDLITAYDAGTGDAAGWAYKRVFGPGGSLAVLKDYLEEDLYQVNEFYGLPTETMVTNWSTLQDMENELFPRIVMGESIESFDTFVKDWNNLGGVKITDEVNAWYQSNK